MTPSASFLLGRDFASQYQPNMHSAVTVRECLKGWIFLRKKVKSLCWMFWWRSFVALAVHDADVHGAGVEVDSAVELGGGLIESHACIPSLRWEVTAPIGLWSLEGVVGVARAAPALHSQLTLSSKGLDEVQSSGPNRRPALQFRRLPGNCEGSHSHRDRAASGGRSLETFGPSMTTAPSYLRNITAVMEAFGYWPSFHDAPVIDFTYELDGAGAIGFTLHGWEMTAEVDTRGCYKLIKHHLVRFAFRDISDPDLERFTSMGNILFGLEFSAPEEYQAEGRFRVRLDSAMGGDLCGSFSARRGEVLAVIPCDKDGRRTEIG